MKQRGDAVHRDSDGGDDHHGAALRVRRMEQPSNGLRADGADGDQQEQRIGQRREDRRFLQSVSEARGWRPPRHDRAGPSDDQAEDVGKIMPGVGQQRHGIGDEAVDRFDDDEAKVQSDSDRERAAEVRRRMVVPMSVSMSAMIVISSHPTALADACRSSNELGRMEPPFHPPFSFRQRTIDFSRRAGSQRCCSWCLSARMTF